MGERISISQKHQLVRAIQEVECEGICIWNRPSLKGNDGELGPLQITKQYVDDVNRITGTSYSYYDRGAAGACYGMMWIYWDHYATVERLGHEPTMEDLARIHNGGPNGWKKASTKQYWRKVEAVLDKQTKDSSP